MEYIDMISRLGIGSAHPGGFGATLAQLERYPLEPGCRVLEVGCGTGRTACHLAAQGFRVTAVDRHPVMLAKAERRAQAMGAKVDFVRGDACMLPFEEASFDVVFAESVTNFVDAADAFEEYRRVLAQGGLVYDRELAVRRPVSEDRLARLVRFFGLRQLWRAEAWPPMAERAGFRRAELLEDQVYSENVARERTRHYDAHELIDEGAYTDIRMWQLTAEYTQIMSDHGQDLGYVLLRATK
jgi:ubiquinone/menaquinone biosynthesis C-methylase UbiE